MADPDTSCIAVTVASSSVTPSTASARPAPDIGSVIARVFDLLEGSGLEPFAAQVASGIVNGACRPCRG